MYHITHTDITHIYIIPKKSLIALKALEVVILPSHINDWQQVISKTKFPCYLIDVNEFLCLHIHSGEFSADCSG